MLCFICAFHANASGQNCDTIYYHDGSVLMITTKINEKDSVLLCQDINGKNILVSDAISYQFLDKKAGLTPGPSIKNLIKSVPLQLSIRYCMKITAYPNQIRFINTYNITMHLI